ncbi:MAG: sodium:solute symporter family protein [Bacteroidetes bacterium]|nr:sodium:solute symporter family protein [Bacteroidota bacterium]
MKVYFTVNDYLIILAYFVAMLVVGLRTKSTEDSAKDYLIAGRTITLPAFVATLVSTFYGGILGIGEFTFNFGIAGWFLYAFPYYIFILIFAFFIAGKIRKTHLFSIPDKLNRTYGKKVSLFAAFLIFFLSTPAPYLYMMGILIKFISGIPVTLAMLIILILSTVFLFKGGLRADVRVNIMEFFLMFIGIGIILPFCFNSLGGMEYLESRLPERYLTVTGGNSIQYIIVWFFIGAWVLVDPSFHQRCYAAKSKKTPKRGIIISLIFWIIFDFMTTTAGLYAKAYFMNDLADPIYSFPALGNKLLPPLAKGIFFLGMMATIMSTLHSYIFISSNTFGRDLIARYRNETDSNIMYNRLGIVASSLFAFFIAKYIPSVVNIWYTVGTLIIPALLISVISSYFEKLQVHSKFILASMITSFSVSLILFILGVIYKVNGVYALFLGLEPMYPGLITGLIVYLYGYSQRKYLQIKSES